MPIFGVVPWDDKIPLNIPDESGLIIVWLLVTICIVVSNCDLLPVEGLPPKEYWYFNEPDTLFLAFEFIVTNSVAPDRISKLPIVKVV